MSTQKTSGQIMALNKTVEFEKWAKSYGLQHYSNEWALLTDGKTEIYQDVFKAGVAAGYTKGVTTMREKAAEVADTEANGFRNTRIAAAIRKLEVE